MGPRLIAITCLVLSSLTAPVLLKADYRSDHEGVRAGPRAAPDTPRRAPESRSTNMRSGNSSRADHAGRTNRLPRLALFGLVAGGAWWAYRKYGRALPPAQLARIGGVAAVGMAVAYLAFFAERGGRRDVASSGSSRSMSRDPHSGRGDDPRGSSYGRTDRGNLGAIPDYDANAEDPRSRSVTRRGRLSDGRRGTLYDHSLATPRPAPPPVVEPAVEPDPAVMAAISQPGRIAAPGLFVADAAQPLAASANDHAQAAATAPAAAAQATPAPGVRVKSSPSTNGTTTATAPVAKPKGTTTNSAAPAKSNAKLAANSPTTVAANNPPASTAGKAKTSPPSKSSSKPAATATANANPAARPTTPAGAAPSTPKPAGATQARDVRTPGVSNERVVAANYQPPPDAGTGGGSSSNNNAASGEGGSGQSGAIGIAPPKEVPEFLRQESVLLDPGEYQIEVGFLYTLTQSSSVLQLDTGDATFVGDLERRQRLMLTNLDFRIGITPKLQGSILIPFGWSSGETVFAGQDQVSSSGGIGDVNLSLTRLITEGDQNSSQILMNVGMSAPTGESNFVSSVSTPGSQLGQGFYTLTGGITFVRVFDPLVMFGGFGFQHRFDTEVAPNVTLSPGELAYYRFGLGWAVNTRVTLNGSFSGSYLTDIALNDRRVAGSAREPMSLRLAATIARAKRNSDTKPKLRTVEPHLTFGLTESAPAVQMGISWSY